MIFTLVTGTPARALPGAPGYSELVPLEGDAVSFPALQGLSVTGDIAGSSVAPPEAGGAWTAAVWRRGSDRPAPLPPLPGDPSSRANGINALGDIAGDSGSDVHNAPGAKRAVVWERDGNIRLLSLPSGNLYTSAWAINARGQVVGRAHGGGFQQAVRWEPDGSATILQTPRPHSPLNAWTIARAINAHGESVGDYHPGEHRKPIRWDASGVGRELETLPDYPSGRALAITNRGDVVGAVHVTTASLQSLGAIWDAQDRLRIVRPLPGHHASAVSGLSSDGTAVGYSRAADGSLAPVKWERNADTPVALEIPAGYAEAWATSINERGEVLVWAWNTLARPYEAGNTAYFVLR